jgi:hypothetical protein
MRIHTSSHPAAGGVLYQAATQPRSAAGKILALNSCCRYLGSAMSVRRTLTPLFLSSMLLLGSGLALAQGRGGHGPGGPGGPREVPGRMVYDNRFHHDHYYPAPGFVAPALPRGSLTVGFGADRYYFHSGIWYRPYGPSFRVFVPPVGVVIPILPTAYVSLQLGGLPYYYANGVYYQAVSNGPGYVVVAPPANADTQAAVATPAPPPPPPRPDPIIYPRNGQGAAQLESDRQECNRWATTQPAAMNDASVFNRAVEACMDGRGYTMR